jgi:hypothetical protein
MQGSVGGLFAADYLLIPELITFDAAQPWGEKAPIDFGLRRYGSIQ